jgi:thymidylate synthase (FAD)
MFGILERWVPLTYHAFLNYRFAGVQLSRDAFGVVRRMLAGEKVDRESSGLSAREWRELMDVIAPHGSQPA